MTEVAEPPFVAEARMSEAEQATYQAWRIRRYGRREFDWTTFVIAFVLALVFTSLAVAMEVVRPRNGAYLAALFMAALFAGIYLPYVTRWRRLRRSIASQKSRYPELFDLRYELSDAGLQMTRRGAVTSYDWAIFAEAIAIDGLLLLRQSDWDATPIPLRGFATPDVAAAAVAFSISNVARASAQPAA